MNENGVPMNKETIQELLKNGTGLDSLDTLAESMQTASSFRSLFAEVVASTVIDDETIPPLLSDWNFILKLNDTSLISFEKYLEFASACPLTVVNTLSQRLADGLRAGCREQYFGRVVRLLLFGVFAGSASPAASGLIGHLLGFYRYCNSEKDSDVDAIRVVTRIGNALVPVKDKLNLAEPLSSFSAWAMTSFMSPNELSQNSFQDLISVSDGKGVISPFLMGSRELYSDNALLSVLSYFLREKGDKINMHSFSCLVYFIGTTRNKRNEVLGILRKHVEDSSDNEEILSYLLLLARLCGTKQNYGQWLLGVISDVKAPAHVVESLTNLIPIDSPGWITAQINFLQKAGKASENCREYVRCGQMRLETQEKEVSKQQKSLEQPQDPDTFIDNAFKEFFLTKKLPQSFRGAAFFNTSWFNVHLTLNAHSHYYLIHRK